MLPRGSFLPFRAALAYFSWSFLCGASGRSGPRVEVRFFSPIFSFELPRSLTGSGYESMLLWAVADDFLRVTSGTPVGHVAVAALAIVSVRK